MNSLIDLHLHSNTPGSDGDLTPGELMEYVYSCAQKTHIAPENVTISLTDHNTTAGLTEACEKSGQYGMNFIPGCEIMVYDPANDLQMEILTYGSFCQLNNPDFQKIISQANEAMKRRIKSQLTRWYRSGVLIAGKKIDLSEERYHQLMNIDSSNDYNFFVTYIKPEIENTINTTLSNKDATKIFYEHIRDETGQLYAPFKNCNFPSPESVLSMTKQLNIISSLPHPGEYRISEDQLSDVLAELVGAGLNGIEVYTRKNSDKMICYLTDYCTNNKLLTTGGSDFHSLDGGGKIGKYRLTNYIPATIAKSLIPRG